MGTLQVVLTEQHTNIVAEICQLEGDDMSYEHATDIVNRALDIGLKEMQNEDGQ